MLGLITGIAIVGGLLGYKIGLYYQAFKHGKRYRISPFDKVVNLELYRKYRVK